jgi:hypothetical protein
MEPISIKFYISFVACTTSECPFRRRQLKLFDTVRLSCMKSAHTFPNIKRLAVVQTDHHDITELFWKYKSTNFSALGKAYVGINFRELAEKDMSVDLLVIIVLC